VCVHGCNKLSREREFTAAAERTKQVDRTELDEEREGESRRE